MDKVLIGLRAQDFHESLRVTGTFGPKDVHFEKTLLVGKAASLAMHLRGLLYVDNITQLKYAASSLGISSLELPQVLRVLEEVDFVSTVKSGDEIKRVEIKVPEFRSGYEDLGERWQQLKPSEIEQASIVTLEKLYRGPVEFNLLKKKLGIGSTEFSILSDVMTSGQLLSVHPVDGIEMAFTALAVDGNPQAYLQWAKKFPMEVQSALATLREHQGLPMDAPAMKKNPALSDALATGVLLPVQVAGATGEHRFIFAPQGGLNPEERTILDKARAILACVRYGQNYAAGVKIRSPRKILQILREKKRFTKGHPDLLSQYGLLVEKMVGEPFKEFNGHWNFQVHDNEENMKALDIAAEMLVHGESPSAHIDLEAQKALFSTTGYLSPPATRPHLSQSIRASTETRGEIIRQLANLARGSISNVT